MNDLVAIVKRQGMKPETWLSRIEPFYFIKGTFSSMEIDRAKM
jgi:hypothetical protein